MKHKVILIGYPGSQKIVPASKYLAEKYLHGFDITYINYTGEIKDWSNTLLGYLKSIPEKQIIFGLDDYLISGPIDMDVYEKSIPMLSGLIKCVKLCESTIEEHNEYPVTTQYTIWDKDVLIEILGHIKTPWEFEINGSKVFNHLGYKTLLRTCIPYFCNSSISGRWEGINLSGLNTEDVQILHERFLPSGEKNVFKDASSVDKIVIFGASGFLGTALVSNLIDKGYKNILCVSRNEGELVVLKEKYPVIHTMSGDIADSWVVKKAMHKAKQVYLLAAMKHVGLAELEVKSCISTNVVGAMNVINESLVTKPEILLFVSTDKAAKPNGVYGCSKKIVERLVNEAEKLNPATKYRTVRYGNILYSTGSVLCKWRDKMRLGQEVVVTDMDATRFFWSIEQALDLIFECIDKAEDSTPFTPKMKSISIRDLLDAMMDKYGKSPVKIIGLQVGENLHEVVNDGGIDSFSSERYTKEEILKLI